MTNVIEYDENESRELIESIKAAIMTQTDNNATEEDWSWDVSLADYDQQAVIVGFDSADNLEFGVEVPLFESVTNGVLDRDWADAVYCIEVRDTSSMSYDIWSDYIQVEYPTLSERHMSMVESLKGQDMAAEKNETPRSVDDWDGSGVVTSRDKTPSLGNDADSYCRAAELLGVDVAEQAAAHDTDSLDGIPFYSGNRGGDPR